MIKSVEGVPEGAQQLQSIKSTGLGRIERGDLAGTGHDKSLTTARRLTGNLAQR